MTGSDRPDADEATAWQVFEQLRWNGSPTRCPHCASEQRCYFLRPASTARRTRTGRPTARRVWKCGACRRQFSVLTGTVLEGTRLPLTSWIGAVDAYVHQQEMPRSVGSAVTRGKVHEVLDRALGDDL